MIDIMHDYLLFIFAMVFLLVGGSLIYSDTKLVYDLQVKCIDSGGMFLKGVCIPVSIAAPMDY